MSFLKNIFSAPYQGYQALVEWYGKRTVLAALLLITACVIAIAYQQFSRTADQVVEAVPEPARTTVALTTANALTGDFSGSLIGTTVATTEATLIAERGGQVTNVGVTLGQFVSAGTIIAQFENAAERAALTQARGALDSALAGAAQSTLSITDADSRVRDLERAIVTAHNNAFASVTQIVTGNIDQFFSSPNTTIPGLRVNGRGNTQTLIQTRNTLRKQLDDWQRNTTTLTATSDPTTALDLARSTINNTIGMVDIFIANFQQERGDTQYSTEEYRGFITSLTQARTALNGLLTSFSDLESELSTAKENVTRATLGGGTGTSLATAQITQARGALQAAEANFNKTVIRTPIAGTISTLSVRTGDFTGPQAPVARITNTDGVEVTTFINEQERTFFAVGTTVRINDSATGTISAIAPDLDRVTQKVEVRIAVNDTTILPGSTVTITLPERSAPAIDTTQPITIPITAIKFTDTAGSVFVVEDGKLVARPVTLGTVRGTAVTVLAGLDGTTPFVVDARGKTAGELVTVISN